MTMSSAVMRKEIAPAKSWPRHFVTAARIFLGFLLVSSVVTRLLNIAPPPPPHLPAAAVAFNSGLMLSGYMMPLIFGTQGVVGVLLLLNRFVPLALALLAPFLVNSFAFHLFLVPAGLPVIAVFIVMELFLAWSYRRAFAPMLAARVAPNAIYSN